MTSIKFAICTKLGTVKNQVIGTLQDIVPGELVKIIFINKYENCDRCVIKFFDRDNKNFGKELYECDTAIVNQLEEHVWALVSQLSEGNKITLNLEIPNKKKVNFIIKNICNVPSLGAGKFYALEMINGQSLNDSEMFHIKMQYHNAQQMAICIRGDRLIKCIEAVQHTDNDNSTIVQSVKSSVSNETYTMSSNSTYYDNELPNVPEASLIDFDNVIPLNKFESQLQHLKNGLPDLRSLTLIEPNGMNEYAHSNYNQAQLNDRHLEQRNSRIQENNPERTNVVSRHATPPSDNYYRDVAPNKQPIIKDFRAPLIRNITNDVPKAIMHKIGNAATQENYTTHVPQSPSFTNNPNIKDFYPSYETLLNNVPVHLRNLGQAENSLPQGNYVPIAIPAVSDEPPTYFVDQTFHQNFRPDPPKVDIFNTTHVPQPASFTNNPNIKDFRPLNEKILNNVPVHLRNLGQAKSSLPQGNYVPFAIPAVSEEPPTYFLDQTAFHQNSRQDPPKVDIIKTSKPRRNRNRNQSKQNQGSTNCYICRDITHSPIHLVCQHIFCPECLLKSLTDLENARCPFKNKNYACNYKLNINNVFSKGINDHEISKGINDLRSNNIRNTKEPTVIGTQRPLVKKNEEAEFFFENNDSNEILFYCKQDKCDGVWIIDKTEGRSIYPCPECETYNCFKCQVIHDNMTCEEYNQYNSAGPNKIPTVTNYNTTNVQQHVPTEPKWKCEFCKYNENLMDTGICVICSRTNDKIMKTKKNTATEYYNLLELEQSDNFIPNFHEFECVICAEMIEPDNGVQLRGCLHNLCRICICKYIESCDQPEIKCPFDGCTNILEDREIKTLVSPQMYDRHLEISLRFAKTTIQNGYQCCMPNCKGWWIFTEGTYEYNCPACGTINCISCKATHPGIVCKIYQQNIFYSKDKNGIETRIKLQNMLAEGIAEHCPKCNVIVVKNKGCQQMHCSMCRVNFVWGQGNKKLQLK